MPRQLITADEEFTLTEVELCPTWPDADPEVAYTIRAISVRQAREIRDGLSSERPVPGMRKTVRVDPERDPLEDAMLHYALVGWVGIEVGGEPAPCDEEHRDMLPAIVRSAIVATANTGNQKEAAKAEEFRQPA